MKRSRYLKAGIQHPRIPFVTSAVAWLVLERLQAPGWVFGVAFTMLGAVAVSELIRLFTGEPVDVLKND